MKFKSIIGAGMIVLAIAAGIFVKANRGSDVYSDAKDPIRWVEGTTISDQTFHNTGPDTEVVVFSYDPVTNVRYCDYQTFMSGGERRSLDMSCPQAPNTSYQMALTKYQFENTDWISHLKQLHLEENPQ